MIAYVATLVARPGNQPELEAALAALAAIIPHPRVSWLAAGEAVDIGFERGDDEPLPGFGEAIANRPVDLVVQPAAGRRKTLLVADMDSTMIAQECIDELADYAGFKPQVAAITERAMRGEIAFETALRERAALLADLPVDTIARVIAERITLTPGARALVATMRANGAYAVLVSGGFTDFVESVGATIGFDEAHANRLLAEHGRLTGAVAEPILGSEAKRATLLELTARLGCAPHDTLAVGDGANDIPMVRAAGLGVAYHAKPALAEVAAARIDHCDLTAILFAQGYARAAFAA